MYCQIILILFAFISVKPISGQDPCSQAMDTLGSNYFCNTLSVSAVCRKSCLNLFDDVIDNCGSNIARAYSTWIQVVCNGSLQISTNCTDIQAALSLDISEGCVIGIANRDEKNCSPGTCRKLFYAVINSCHNTYIKADCPPIAGGGHHNVMEPFGLFVLLFLNAVCLTFMI